MAKIPLGQRIDEMYDLDQKIKKSEATTNDLKRTRAELEARLLRKFGKESIEGCKGSRGVAGIKKSSYPSIKDRKKFWKYVIAKKAYDLLQNRVAKKAYDDRAEDGEIVPGISVFEKFGISIRKRGR